MERDRDRPTPNTVTAETLARLAEQAWAARDSAYILGDTKVGCAALADDSRIFVGCNVEHRYRCHDVHAEVNAISSMVAAGATGLVAIIVAAERERFTPCGSCLDWIFQFGGASCMVGYQSAKGGQLHTFTAQQLMPYYPQ